MARDVGNVLQAGGRTGWRTACGADGFLRITGSAPMG